MDYENNCQRRDEEEPKVVMRIPRSAFELSPEVKRDLEERARLEEEAKDYDFRLGSGLV
ncbi:hypothetical protein HYW76_04755 [Candidatus Pacearchaeota archaeon]|nr:hypothetical protein [Candidatus Pacearchaeota archaeon]